VSGEGERVSEKYSGEALCQLADIPDGLARSFSLETEGTNREVVLVRQGDRVHGYFNWCPHRGTPLDWVKDNFLDREGQYIICATHGAYFEIADGLCIAGPCRGDRLRSFPVEVTASGVCPTAS
jgi:nitrite reductase/ring-hydroxylating ferredoxin subunit